MPTVNTIKLKIRRGTNAQRKTITLDQGELGYSIDTQRVFVGDGSTQGGIAIGSKAFPPSNLTSYLTTIPAEKNDLAYGKNFFYQLTGTPSTDINSWAFVGTVPDTTDNTLIYDSNNTLAISGSNAMKVLSGPAINVFPLLTGVTENDILTSAFSDTGAITGGAGVINGPGIKIGINHMDTLDIYDNKLGVSTTKGVLSSIISDNFYYTLCSEVFSVSSTYFQSPLYGSISGKAFCTLDTSSWWTSSVGIGLYIGVNNNCLTADDLGRTISLKDRTLESRLPFQASTSAFGFPRIVVNKYGIVSEYADAVTHSPIMTGVSASLPWVTNSTLSAPQTVTGLSAKHGNQTYAISSAGFLYLPTISVSGNSTYDNVLIPVYRTQALT